MPRKPNPDLEQHILTAARRLWRRGGEKALTLRAVANEAGSNTPAVYRRFKNRQELVRALLRQLQTELGERLKVCRSIEEMGESYIDYALTNRHDFELFHANVRRLSPRRSSPVRPVRESRPNVGLMEERLAQRLGGSSDDHSRLALALWAAADGTITLLLTQALPPGHEAELRRAFRQMVQVLLSGAFTEGRSG